MLTSTDTDSEFESIRLGKKIELKYIPFSELAVPFDMSFDVVATKQVSTDIKQSGSSIFTQINNENIKTTKTLKKADIDDLKHSIAKFGLLKPFEVAVIQEHREFFFGKSKYLVIDGQRRYFAIRELLKLPTVEDERQQKENLQTNSQHENVLKSEMQAQEQFDRLSIRDYILIPCIVYPYTSSLQITRHSLEGKRFSKKPSKDEFEFIKKMSSEGIDDLNPDDLTALPLVHNQIEAEKKFIEDTLREIKTRIADEQNKDEEKSNQK